MQTYLLNILDVNTSLHKNSLPPPVTNMAFFLQWVDIFLYLPIQPPLSSPPSSHQYSLHPPVRSFLLVGSSFCSSHHCALGAARITQWAPDWMWHIFLLAGIWGRSFLLVGSWKSSSNSPRLQSPILPPPSSLQYSLHAPVTNITYTLQSSI